MVGARIKQKIEITVADKNVTNDYIWHCFSVCQAVGLGFGVCTEQIWVVR